MPPEYVAAELRVDVQRAVAGLSEEDAALCRLVAAGTVTEAAEALGVSRSTVHRRLRRLRGPLSHLRVYGASGEPDHCQSNTDQEEDPCLAD